jgi:hypothetical protein
MIAVPDRTPFARDFFDRPALEVAPDLLGRILVRTTPDGGSPTVGTARKHVHPFASRYCCTFGVRAIWPAPAATSGGDFPLLVESSGILGAPDRGRLSWE